MPNFKKGGFRKGNGSFGDRPRFGGGRDRDSRPGKPMQLFAAVCAECKKNCEVPFRPTGDKPVYCLDCFTKQRHVPGRNSNGADGPRPDFRRDTFPQREPERAQPQSDGRIDALKRQLDSLESKVDRLLGLMNTKPVEPVVVVEEAKPKKAKVVAKKTAKGKK